MDRASPPDFNALVCDWFAHRFQMLQPINDFSGQASFARNVNYIWACWCVLLKVIQQTRYCPPLHSTPTSVIGHVRAAVDIGYKARLAMTRVSL